MFSSFAQAASVKGESGLIQLGTRAPDFSLPDVVTGQTVSKNDFSDKKALLVIILCRHCPYVQNIKQGLAQLGRDYAEKDIAIVGISSNDPADFPEDSPESLKQMVEEEGFSFPVLFDGAQKAAKAFTAVATPDFFLFDSKRRLIYRGQFDESRPGDGKPVTGNDVRTAIDALLSGKPVLAEQKPSFGCSIKWIKGNTPTYAE